MLVWLLCVSGGLSRAWCSSCVLYCTVFNIWPDLSPFFIDNVRARMLCQKFAVGGLDAGAGSKLGEGGGEATGLWLGEGGGHAERLMAWICGGLGDMLMAWSGWRVGAALTKLYTRVAPPDQPGLCFHTWDLLTTIASDSRLSSPLRTCPRI